MRRLVVCLPLLLASCGSVESYFGDAPRQLEGFPVQTTEGQIYATASLGDPERDLGVDLVEEQRVLPIHLEIRRNEGAENLGGIGLFPRQMNFRLFLPDGTILARVADDQLDYDSDDNVQRAISRRKFSGGPLSGEVLDGYVFFRLPPQQQLELDGVTVTIKEPSVVMSVDLRKSVLAFDWTLGDGRGRQTFFVGIDN